MTSNELEQNLFHKRVRIISIIVGEIRLPEKHCYATLNIYIRFTVTQLQRHTHN